MLAYMAFYDTNNFLIILYNVCIKNKNEQVITKIYLGIKWLNLILVL